MPFCTYKEEARWLIENGVIVLDIKAVAPINRPLITHIAGMPINDVLDLIREKERLLTISENEFNFRKREFENASALPVGNREYAAMAETIRENGDKAVVCDRFAKLKNKN